MKKTMIRALGCLAIAVEKDVYSDVVTRVRAYTDELEAENKKLRQALAYVNVTLRIHHSARGGILTICAFIKDSLTTSDV